MPNPYYVTIPLGPVIVGVGVGVTIFLLPRATAPAWASELNPTTRLPYTSAQEYEEVRRLSPDEIKQRRARITNSKPNGPPAGAPTPSTQAEREQEKKTQRCAKIALIEWGRAYVRAKMSSLPDDVAIIPDDVRRAWLN